MVHLIATLLIAQNAQPAVTITLQGSGFHLQNGEHSATVEIAPKLDQATSVRFRRDDSYAVWDERGLTTRAGDWVYSTRLKEIATTPKLFSREQILESVKRAKDGGRELEANALAGATRIGNICYFLVRFNEGQQPWMEALVSVDLTDPHPKAKLLGRFEGHSLATGWLEDRLFVRNEKLSVITRTDDEWGLASYDPTTGKFDFKSAGTDLRATGTLSGDRIVFVENTLYGPTLMGIWNPESGQRTTLFESRGHLRLLDTSTPLVGVVGVENKLLLRNIESGAQVELPAGSGAARTELGVLAWWPRNKPTGAALYDPVRWEKIAEWTPAGGP